MVGPFSLIWIVALLSAIAWIAIVAAPENHKISKQVSVNNQLTFDLFSSADQAVDFNVNCEMKHDQVKSVYANNGICFDPVLYGDICNNTFETLLNKKIYYLHDNITHTNKRANTDLFYLPRVFSLAYKNKVCSEKWFYDPTDKQLYIGIYDQKKTEPFSYWLIIAIHFVCAYAACILAANIMKYFEDRRRENYLVYA